MLSNKLMPIRATVGDPIAIAEIEVKRTSSAAENLRFEVEYGDDINSMVHRSFYQHVIPQIVEGDPSYLPPRYRGAPGTDTLPAPGKDLPFTLLGGHFASLFGVVGEVGDEDTSRSLTVSLAIKLKPQSTQQLAGGLCYGGYPFLPYYITKQGENSANFGLPREIGLTWTTSQGVGFLDDEDAITNQEPTSHGGVHVLGTGPVPLSSGNSHDLSFMLHLSDFPRLVTQVSLADGGLEVTELWGFIIPFLFVFEYKEDMRYPNDRQRGPDNHYTSRIPAGLLAATQNPPNLDSSYFGLVQGSSDPAATVKYAGACADYLLLVHQPEGLYYPMSASSIFGQGRTYGPGEWFEFGRRPLPDNHELEEVFVSNALQHGHEVRLFIEQGEEFNRCIAGMSITFGSRGQTPPLPTGLERIGVRVYEIDPPRGVSPIAPTKDLEKDKYSTCIFETYVKASRGGGGIPFDLEFTRPSSSRYLVIVLSNAKEGSVGHVMIESLELVQSAHVSIVPRATRTQVLQRMHFRLIGPDLADDYSQLGGRGFSLSVEHLVGGQRRDILFSASSLLELLQSGTAHLRSNHRRALREREIVTTRKGSYNLARSTGWNRSETGLEDSDTDPSWNDSRWYDPDDDPREVFGQDAHQYKVFGNQEIRTHTTHIGKIDDTLLAIMPSEIQGRLESRQEAFENDSGNSGDLWPAWTKVSRNQLGVRGIYNVNMPPYFILYFEKLRAVFEKFGRIPDNSDRFYADRVSEFFAAILDVYTSQVYQYLALTGCNVGFSGSIGIQGYGSFGESFSIGFNVLAFR
jgi:hypothetical protein